MLQRATGLLQGKLSTVYNADDDLAAQAAYASLTYWAGEQEEYKYSVFLFENFGINIYASPCASM